MRWLALLLLASCSTGPTGDTCMLSTCGPRGPCPESTEYALSSGTWTVGAEDAQRIFGATDGPVTAVLDVDASTLTLSWNRADGAPVEVGYTLDEIGFVGSRF